MEESYLTLVLYLVDALSECYTKSGAYCYAADVGHYERHRLFSARLETINQIVNTALAKAKAEAV